MTPFPSVLIAMSAFKGTLTNTEACRAVSQTLRELGWPCRELPLGDGGRGTLESIRVCLGGERVSLEACGPLGERVYTTLLCLPDAVHPKTIYVESADTCGYHLVPEGKRDALRASSLGLGKVLAEANRRWGLENPHFLIGLGDSAVSDMGVGMLTALGYRFLDESGNQLPADATALSRIHRWLRPEAPVGASPITVLCDVVNPLCGPLGSARIFSGQKGADESQIHLIEAGMENFAREIARSGRDWREVPMTGAAGGLGAAFAAFLGAKLVPGAESLLAWIGFDKILAEHQIVITGEGRTDAQTLSGKTPLACCDRAERNRKWNLILSGQLAAGISLGRSRTRLAGIHECGALPSAEEALRRKTREIFSDPAFLERIQRD